MLRSRRRVIPVAGVGDDGVAGSVLTSLEPAVLVVDPGLAVSTPSGIEIDMGVGDLWRWLAVRERELRRMRLRAAGLWGGMKWSRDRVGDAFGGRT
jgi:hypothetical protein